jgi:hypothetical protein
MIDGIPAEARFSCSRLRITNRETAARLDEGLDPNYLTEEPLVSFVGVCPGAVEGRRAALALFASRKGDG